MYVFTPTITAESSDWYRGTADALYQNLDFLKKSHEPYVVIAGGDCVYKLDYGKVLEYHIEKKADITVVCKEMPPEEDVTRFGLVKLNDDGRITDFEEKPMLATSSMISCGIYVIRRRQLIELLERCAAEDRYDFVTDILVRYKNLKRIYAYKLGTYWSNIASVDSYYKTNMDFLKPDVRHYFFKEYPEIYSKVDDLPPAKYNPGANVKNSLVSSGCILNGTVENSEVFFTSFDSDVLGLYDHLYECENIDELNELGHALLEVRDKGGLETFEAALVLGNHTRSVKDLINLTQNLDLYRFYPDISDDEGLGRLYADELGTIDIPEHIQNYFDYEAYGRDVRINEGGVFAPGGYVSAVPEGFKEYYHGPQDIPPEHRIFAYPEKAEPVHSILATLKRFQEAPPAPKKDKAGPSHEER